MNLERFFISVFLLMTGYSLCYAQKDPIKYGKISENEIKMTVYEKDTSASAIVLTDFGTAEIVYANDEFQLNFSTHKRMKILKSEGLDYAKETIRLYRSSSGNYEDLASIKASTYNMENGKLVETKFSKKDLITEEESKNYILKKFALPNVKIGSIIEFEYTYTSPYLYNLSDWYFQDEIPVIWSEFRTTIPEYFSFSQIFGGYISPDISESNSSQGFIANSSIERGANFTRSTIVNQKIDFTNNNQRWVFKDVPAFKNEKFITTSRDYLARVEFELQSIRYPNSPVKNYSTTWEKIAQLLMEDENFGLALNRHGIVKELSEQINQSDSLTEKINKAVALIKKQMKWDESYSLYTRRTLREAFNRKEGNIAEINLLLVNLLRSVGVEANPVLFSTRTHGAVKQAYPMVNAFNGVLASVKIKGKEMLIDATHGFYNPGELPPSFINGNGMKIYGDNKIEWIPLLNTELYSTVSMTVLKIEEGKLKAEITKNSSISSASELRNKIYKKSKQQFIDDVIKETSAWDVKSYTIDNEGDLTKPVVEKISIDNFNQIDVNADMIYIPAIVSAEKETNPFTSDTRRYPVDFGVPISEKSIINITIPDGYDAVELPADLKLILPNNDASFSYMAKKNGNIIQVSSTFKISRTVYTPSEYQLLKEFYKNMISKNGEQIVLKKL